MLDRARMSLVDTTRRDAYARCLASELADDRWSVDELRVVQLVVDGLVHGRDVYGALDLATDTRDFALEARAEARDLVVYRACQLLAEQDKRRAELELAVAREIIDVEQERVGDGAVGSHPTNNDGTNARRPHPTEPAPFPSLRARSITVPPMPSGKAVTVTLDEKFDPEVEK